jgi:uncharacterized membrane protein HdeD (DUF308 family)
MPPLAEFVVALTLIASGAISILFGVVLAVPPAVGIPSPVWLIGAYAIAFGVLLLITEFRVRGQQNEDSGRRSSRVS